jgi:hypothetical protein
MANFGLPPRQSVASLLRRLDWIVEGPGPRLLKEDLAKQERSITSNVLSGDRTRERCSVRQVNMAISLAFLAPNLVKAAVEGRLPRGIGIERLRDPPTEWSRQFEALGLNSE